MKSIANTKNEQHEIKIPGFESNLNIYKALVDSIRDYAIFIIDTKGNILTWNKGAEIIKGYSEKEVIGKNISIFYTEEDNRKKLPAKNLAKAKREKSYECEGWRVIKDGSLIWVDIVFTCLYNTEGKLIGFVKITKEITERKIEEDKFKGLLEAAPDAMIITDNRGDIVLINKQAEILFGYTRSELINKKIEILVPAASKNKHIGYREKYIQNPQTRPMGQPSELFAVRKNGTEIPVEISLAPLKTINSTLFLASIRDITERKKLTEELQSTNETQRLLTARIEKIREEERTAISREIHDELGQQLTALKMDISWLAKKALQDSLPAKEKIQDAMTLIDDMIKSVRRISSALRPSMLDDLGLEEALEWYSTDFQKRTGVNVKFNSTLLNNQLPNNISTALFRIYQESLTNIARHADATLVSAGLKSNHSVITLTIKDNGKGFDIKKIRTKNTLGLLGINERAILIGGKCDIQSRIGKGTVITITVNLN